MQIVNSLTHHNHNPFVTWLLHLVPVVSGSTAGIATALHNPVQIHLDPQLNHLLLIQAWRRSLQAGCLAQEQAGSCLELLQSLR